MPNYLRPRHAFGQQSFSGLFQPENVGANQSERGKGATGGGKSAIPAVFPSIPTGILLVEIPRLNIRTNTVSKKTSVYTYSIYIYTREYRGKLPIAQLVECKEPEWHDLGPR